MNNDNTNDSITLINKYNVVSQHSNNKHTTQVSKIFIFMVVRNLLRATGGQLDPLQFTYQPNWPVDDAVSLALHFIFQNPESPCSYAQIFVDYSFYVDFNTIILRKVFDKLSEFSLYQSMCFWVLDFLLHHSKE